MKCEIPRNDVIIASLQQQTTEKPSPVPAAKPHSDASATCKPRTSASGANSTKRPAPASAGPPLSPSGNAPTPDQIDEVHEVPLPDRCGPFGQTHVVQQIQVEIPRKPIHRQFNIHVGRCRQCRCLA